MPAETHPGRDTMAGMSSDDAASQETHFVMDPEATLWTLARQLVSHQRTYAELRRSAETARRLPDSAELRRVVADFEALERSWHGETLPSIIASMQVAIEVWDTFGPGRTEVADDLEAAVWNNKYFVWVKELAGGAPPA